MTKIYVDGKEYEVEEGKNLLDACLGAGLDLPYFCWHPSMGSVGSCRQCAVRVYQDENDNRGKILMGCMTPVKDGMRIGLEEKTVSEFRDKCIEVTMANHPHDCPVCEEGGECHLQDVTIMSDHTSRRYRGQKKTYENQYLGPCISHEMNRCITCYRCVRFYNDYAGGKDLAALASRENTYFGRHEDGCLESIFSGNLVEVCPTGVFTDKTLGRSYNRKWDLQTAPSICHGCSLGCNISPAERQGKIKRITNRYHGEINSYFICDKGRFAYDHVNSDSRLRTCTVAEEKSDYDAAMHFAGVLMAKSKRENFIGIGSETASIEENYLLKMLVGAENFCSGMSAKRQRVLKEILTVHHSPCVNMVSLKAIEDCDAVLVLGEDLMNSAPRMALSVRQATRNLSFDLAKDIGVPRWQDEAVRILAQETRSPLITATVGASEIDEIASESLHLSPGNIALFGFAVAAKIDQTLECPKLDDGLDIKAKQTANVLMNSKNPLVISGSSLNSVEVIQASAQICAALCRKRSNGSTIATACAYVLPEANSLGLAMLLDDKSLSLDELEDELPSNNSVFILQNDIYSHMSRDKANALFNKCENVIALSQLANHTTNQSSVVFPAASFVETEGTLVNNEGRAQRFFEVFSATNPAIKDNWKTLINFVNAYAKEVGEKNISDDLQKLTLLKHFDDVVTMIAEGGGYFSQWKAVAPDSLFRIAGMRMPRQPHRYSGRTSLQANIKVSENKAPVDDDSALGFTMEGAPIERPPALNALVWSPGWNSNEAINKFQDEIGGHLRGGDPGIHLVQEKNRELPNFAPPKEKVSGLQAVSQARLFDSCELTVLSNALSQRAEMRVAMLNEKTAEQFSVSDGDRITISVEEAVVSLTAIIDTSIPDDIVTVPDDVSTRVDLCSALLPANCQISRGGL